MVPVDRLVEPLERSQCDALLQRDRFDVLPLQFRQQTANVRGEQSPSFDAVETIDKESVKLGERLFERCDILERPCVVSS